MSNCSLMIFFLHIFIVIDCQWSEWMSQECSTSCGMGTRTKYRRKLVEESNGGTCNGPFSMIESCENYDCPGKTTSVNPSRRRT